MNPHFPTASAPERSLPPLTEITAAAAAPHEWWGPRVFTEGLGYGGWQEQRDVESRGWNFDFQVGLVAGAGSGLRGSGREAVYGQVNECYPQHQQPHQHYQYPSAQSYHHHQQQQQPQLQLVQYPPGQQQTHSSPPPRRRSSDYTPARTLRPSSPAMTVFTRIPRSPPRHRTSPIPTHQPHPHPQHQPPHQEPPASLPPPQVPPTDYHLHLLQPPLAARSCGFGERDRRVIDPPPILCLSLTSPAAPNSLALRHASQHAVVHCTIWSEDGRTDVGGMPGGAGQRRLMGGVVAGAFRGVDEEGVPGVFFCFPDLSVRTPGRFRLRFVLVVVDPRETKRKRFPIVAQVMSDVFTVYNAKDFPGMRRSTGLTRKLKEQGCLISIKKGNGAEDDEDEAEDGNGGRPRRRRKAGRD